MLFFSQYFGTFHSFHILLIAQARFDSEACVHIRPVRFLSFATAALLLGDMILKPKFPSDVFRALWTSVTFCLWLLMDSWIVILESWSNFLLGQNTVSSNFLLMNTFMSLLWSFPIWGPLLIHIRFSAHKCFHGIASVFS